ncbi:MAG: VWA domain-containing protein, partial [Chloroflexota bacterium]
PKDDTNIRSGANAAPDRSQAPDAPRAFALPHTSAQRARQTGRHNAAVESHRGRRVGHAAWDAHTRDIAPLATALAISSAPRSRELTRDQIRMHRRRAPSRRLVLLLVDGSGSMGARERMAQTKAVLLGMLDNAYRARVLVALQVFRDEHASVLVPPTRHITQVAEVVTALPTGGRTPIAAALRDAANMAATHRLRVGGDVLLVVITDGRYRDQVDDAASEVIASGAHTLVVDSEPGPIRLGRARALARTLSAEYVQLEATG